MILVIFNFVLVFCLTYFYYLRQKYNYWNARGIKGPRPLPIFGNYAMIILGKESEDDYFKKIYNNFPDEQVVGLYRGYEPLLLIRDPNLVQQVFVKNFNVFRDRGIWIHPDEFHYQNIFNVGGQPWRILRKQLSPLFTTGTLKHNMMPQIQNCVEKFINFTNTLIENKNEHEIRSLTTKHTMKVIGSCAFGLNFNTLIDKVSNIEIIGKKIFTLPAKARIWMALDLLFPGIREYFSELSKTHQVIEQFFLELVTKIIEKRQNNSEVRKDLMELMIEFHKQGKVTKKLDDEEIELQINLKTIAAQAFAFFAGGFETSATTMAFLIHELAYKPDIQEKVYQEICGTYEQYTSKIPNQGIQDLKYLEMVVDATLRRYPILGVLTRKASADYNFPGTTINIQKGTDIFVSVAGLHCDPKYFSNPDEFDPEVFSLENKKKVHPNVYLPFGIGPRNCIGMKLAKIQMLLGLASFFKNFRVEPPNNTHAKLCFNPNTLTLAPLNGIYVNIFKR